MDKFAQRQQASEIVAEIKSAFEAEILPGVLADREGENSANAAIEIGKGRRIDTRLPRFLSRSGKGGPGHEEYANVTLFDHASSVAMAAATLTALDLIAEGADSATARSCAAVSFAVGLMHDSDKLTDCKWDAVSVETIAHLFGIYGIGRFLGGFGVNLAPEQFAVLITFDEVRTAHTSQAARVPDDYVQAVRRYVRLADKLDGIFLSDVPATSARKAVAEWNKAISAKTAMTSDAFAAYRALVMTDAHHPFILANFASSIEEQCARLSGMRPLFHAVRDEILVTVLPESVFDEIVDAAAREVADELPFDCGVLISPAGVPKPTGARPAWRDLVSIVHAGVQTGDTRRLLSVKVADLKNHQESLVAMAVAAGTPIIDLGKIGAGQTVPLIAPQQADSPAYKAVVTASLVSLAIGIEEDTRNKAFHRKAREEDLVARLGDTVPPWLAEADGLTRRTALALLATARIGAEPDLGEALFGEHGVFAGWFSATGVFAGMLDKSSAVRDAVADRLGSIARGTCIPPSGGEWHCLITGEAVSGDAVSGTDGLYGINSSAFSYREGRPEEKFSETAGTHLSPMSYAEYRLRGVVFKAIKATEGGIPVRLSSPTAGGIFSLAAGDMNDRDLGLFDMVRSDAAKRHYVGMETYLTRTHLGRFETMPRHFGDRSEGGGVAPGRISFLRIAMQAALRYGRPVHVFSGLPHARKEFFYCDCIDPELRILLGKDGFRLEELPKAIDLLGLVGAIAAPAKASGLNMVNAAKQFCVPLSRFGAACLAWAAARDNDDPKEATGLTSLASSISHFINQEMLTMDRTGSTAAIVTLGRLATAIQRQPRFSDGANDESFLFRTSMEAVTEAHRSGQTDRDALVAYVGGAIETEGERRQKGSKGFYSAKTNRSDGQNIDDAVRAFAEFFVDEIWNGIFRGRTPSSTSLRLQLSAYRYVFTRGMQAAAPADLAA
jgi:hypothetical protein